MGRVRVQVVEHLLRWTMGFRFVWGGRTLGSLALGTSRLLVGVFVLTDRVAAVVWAVLWLRHRIRGTA